MLSRYCKKEFFTVVTILTALLLGGMATVASAFSVDVKNLYYADYDPLNSSATRRVINCDFSGGSLAANIITIPAGAKGVVQVPAEEVPPLTYTFGPYPGPSNDIAVTLDTGAAKATLTTATNGGLIINTTSTPNTPPVPQWVYAAALTNFAGMSDATKGYHAQIGFGSLTPGPHPEFSASWVPAAGGGRNLILRAAIFDDTGAGTYTWGPATAPINGFNPVTGVIVLRIRCLDPIAGGNSMVFDYSLDNGTNWTAVGTLTFGFTAGNVPMGFQHLSFPGKFPFVSLRVESDSQYDPFQVSSQHWDDAQGNVYHAWPRVNDPGQALYSAVSMNSPGYLDETPLAFNSSAGYWSLSGTLFSDDFNDNAIDAAKWTTAGSSVAESDGYLKVNQQAAGGAGGKVMSRTILVNPYAEIVVQRRANVFAADNYFNGLFSLYFGNTADFASGFNLNAAAMSVVVSHANYDYGSGGEQPAHGFYLGRYSANFPNPSVTSEAVTPVWGSWFVEKIVYNPVTGVAKLYIDDVLKATVTVGVLPATARYMNVLVQAWGWNTGHYNYSDDLTVSQPWTGGNVYLSSNTPPAAGAVVFNFTATKQGGGTETVQRPVTGYVESFAGNLQPTGNVTTATPAFSWSAVGGATFYAVQLSNANGNRIWNKYGIPSATTSAVYNVDGTGPNLILGQTYSYEIVTSVVTGGVNNDSFAKGTFTYTAAPPPTLSFSGWVKSSPNWPSTSGMLPAVGAQVSAFSPTAPSTPIATTTVDPSTGAFTLTGIPQSSDFYVAVQPPQGYLPVVSKFMNWNANIQALLPFVLFTPAQYSTTLTNTPGTGIIIGRVAQKSNPTTFLSGATVTAAEWSGGVPTGTTYPVTYTGGVTATGADGIYMVKNVPSGKLIQLTATLAGYLFDFNGAVVSAQSGVVSEESFFGSTVPTISFSGYVMDSAATPAPVAGALIEKMGNTPRTAISNADGSYTLTGLPSGTPFHLKITKEGSAPSYTADMSSTGNMVNTVEQAFNLFPANPNQLTTWGVEAGKGIIRARVRDEARNPIGGVVISATSQFGQTYSVCYDDACSALTSTSASSGRYVIKNVLPGDLVTVRATKAGWTFPNNNRIYHIYAGGIHQGGITGTGADPGAEEQAIRNGFVTAVGAVNSANLAGFMAFISDNYLNNGEAKAVFQNNVQGLITAGGQLAYRLGTITIQGDTATVLVTWIITMGGQQEVNPETLIFRKINGTWLIYGNQQRHAVRAESQHWPDGYHAAFVVEDPSRQITAVTVTGPGITGSVSLTSHQQTWDGQLVNVWWNVSDSPFIAASIPSPPPTYTITVTEPSGSTPYSRTINGWVQNFATNLSPVGQAGGPVVFTWTGVPEATTYGVELNDNSYHRMWERNEIPVNQTWTIFDGWQVTPLVQGTPYRYWIVSRDKDGNASFAEGQFTYNGTTGISFTQQVTATNSGTPVQGVAVTLAGNPNPTPSATSDASGNFTLAGVPAGSNFTVMMAKTGSRPTYTAIQKSLSNLPGGGAPFRLYTSTETDLWPPVNFATKGAIATRVVDPAGSYIAGAVVTAQSTLHPNVPYSVTYRDDADNFGGTATYGNGRFYVLGVDEGDIVTVTAVKNGYAFQPRTFLTKAGGISQGRITGTVGPFGGDMNHDGRLTLADALLVLQVAAGIPPSAAIYLDADVNRDGMIDQTELIYILQSVAGLR